MFEGATSGLLGDADDHATVADAMEPGESAVVIVYENRWAGGSPQAVRRNGGQLIASQRIPVQDLLDALEPRRPETTTPRQGRFHAEGF